jgi:uncharacterized membrane protein YjfL (UPF0719 family)
MNTKKSLPFAVAALFIATTSSHAQSLPAPTWHAQSLLQALANMLVFALVGIAAAILGFKLFDKCTPGHLAKEIIENKNVAAALVGAAVILGVCIIVAAAMIG